ncbi:MAG: hypothetical protein ABH868_04190 [bacterium]
MNNKSTDENISYDPANVAAMIVIIIFTFAVLFWLLWSLLVFKGGILTKMIMLFHIVIGKQASSAFGVSAWDGWIINTGALLIAAFFTTAVVRILKKKKG